MALYTQPTLAELLAQVRRELLDPSARWWPDSELTGYLQLWQHQLQSQFEFVWGTAVLEAGEDGLWGGAVWGQDLWGTGGTSALAGLIDLSSIASDMLRPDAVYYNVSTDTRRLRPVDKQDLELAGPEWRASTSTVPEVVYSENASTLGVWPAPSIDGTLTFEYPILTTLTASSDVLQIPAWTRYSATSYCAYRALARFGPNQNLNKAGRYKLRYERNVRAIRKLYDGYFPGGDMLLRPASTWARNSLERGYR